MVVSTLVREMVVTWYNQHIVVSRYSICSMTRRNRLGFSFTCVQQNGVFKNLLSADAFAVLHRVRVDAMPTGQKTLRFQTKTDICERRLNVKNLSNSKQTIF